MIMLYLRKGKVIQRLEDIHIFSPAVNRSRKVQADLSLMEEFCDCFTYTCMGSGIF